jgi:tRNA-splicing ligase RtcB (3'-phosphate/5'-hydroxy nucleic acid ligase)
MSNDYSNMQTYRHDGVNITKGARYIIKGWTVGVDVEDGALKQAYNMAQMPFIFKHIALMPDVHSGIGSTVGSVIPTVKAIVPSACGVDIGCGMQAVRTTLKASQLPSNLADIRAAIEAAVPHGRTDNGGKNDRGAWSDAPDVVNIAWIELEPKFKKLVEKHPKLATRTPPQNHLGTLGTGNHFIEMCIDENQDVWIMLHSGSRGVGNRFGTHFIELAKKDMERYFINNSLPDINLAYLPEGSLYFDDYIEAVSWAQRYAKINRELMMRATLKALRKAKGIPMFETVDEVIDCHHNYVERENHFGKNVWVTRKGAIRARKGDWGVIPGSMGAKSFIVRGLGNQESFTSASHGAGRKMSRTEAKSRFTLKDHKAAVAGVECRVDKDVIDETPGAYKSIDDVMQAQRDLVEIVHTLKQCVCIKG